MFNRDISAYRSTPRSLQTSKFGPYASLDVVRKKKFAERALDVLCVAAFGIGFCTAMFLWLSK